MNVNEQLISPADYAYIDISERLSGGQFEKFALEVCRTRLASLEKASGLDLNPLRLLPGLSEDEEADRLGIERLLTRLSEKEAQEWQAALPALSQGRVSSLNTLLLYHWSQTQNLRFSNVVADYVSNTGAWEYRLGDYRHSMLFTIKTGKVGIRKFYCGWGTFTQLASGNIRYLLELLDQSLLLWLRSSHTLKDPVSPEVQTIAAQGVGKKNLTELEGLSVNGAQLTKLLLGLGRVFQVMATESIGHAPEVNQFHIEEAVFAPMSHEADQFCGVLHSGTARPRLGER